VPLEGFWFNRGREWHARNQGKEYGAYDFATKYQVSFAQLPAFRHLSPEDYRAKVKDLILEIEEETRIARGEKEVLGVAAILAQNPLEPPPTRKPEGRPEEIAGRPAPRPLFHAKDLEVRKAFKGERGEFLATYWDASERLQELCGRPAAEMGFPLGCYPPALPYAGGPAPSCPAPPPTRTIEKIEIEGLPPKILRGPIPVITLPTRIYGIPRGDPG
jgi:hypothetical protein